MKRFRAGMTLFELLVVMTIIGIVYSIGLFTLKKEKVTAATMTISTIKSTLGAMEHSGEIRMVCDEACRECRVYSSDDALATLHLSSQEAPVRYGFDHFGELKPLGNVVTRVGEELRQGCFEVSLRPDGTFTPLILKSKQSFYVYTPLGRDKPFVAHSDEAVRQFLFHEASYPLRSDDYYGVQ
ncbi:MAG TPA: type II secretion system protein [Sulfuricurvum sp.]|nr:type II secretion system protein [Sulfuricurvum sp.]